MGPKAILIDKKKSRLYVGSNPEPSSAKGSLYHCSVTLINIFNTSTQGFLQLCTQIKVIGTRLRIILEVEKLFASIQPKDQILVQYLELSCRLKTAGCNSGLLERIFGRKPRLLKRLPRETFCHI